MSRATTNNVDYSENSCEPFSVNSRAGFRSIPSIVGTFLSGIPLEWARCLETASHDRRYLAISKYFFAAAGRTVNEEGSGTHFDEVPLCRNPLIVINCAPSAPLFRLAGVATSKK